MSLGLQFIFFLIGILPRAVSRAENITCSSQCSPGPNNKTETYNITSGECLFGCQPGYAGHNCSVECPSNCFQHLQNDTETCNATTKECLYGCKDGFYGSDCTQRCTDEDRFCKRCTAKNDNSVIVCNECITNFYRDSGKCLSCNYWCKQDPSSPVSGCRENDGYCNHGCRTGRYGTKCGLRCSSTCKDACHRENGTCDGEECKYTSYCGPTCDISCQDGCISQHCNKSCDCVQGCQPNYWGEQCKALCNANCMQPTDSNFRTCDESNGTCLYGCKDNLYWGNECRDYCPDDCVNGICQQLTGTCTDGCKSSNKEQTDNTAMIVGVSLGIFSAVVVVYAIYVTVLLKRKTTDKGVVQMKKSIAQTTYVNLGFKSDIIANQDRTGSSDNVDISREDADNPDKQYTSLDHSKKDEYTAYDVIKRA